MDIKTSLAIMAQHPTSINFFRVGAFVRVYNQSFYLLTEQLHHPLNVTMRRVKSADNRLVIYGGFPVTQVSSKYPKAIRTTWGFRLAGDFDVKAYDEWFVQWEKAARWQQTLLLPSSPELIKN